MSKYKTNLVKKTSRLNEMSHGNGMGSCYEDYKFFLNLSYGSLFVALAMQYYSYLIIYPSPF